MTLDPQKPWGPSQYFILRQDAHNPRPSNTHYSRLIPAKGTGGPYNFEDYRTSSSKYSAIWYSGSDTVTTPARMAEPGIP